MKKKELICGLQGLKIASGLSRYERELIDEAIKRIKKHKKEKRKCKQQI